MQYVDNNMDDLIRKAAADYPLKTDGADWDAVMNKLQAAEVPSSVPLPADAKRKRRKFLWLFLLIPAALLCITEYHKSGLVKLTNNKINSTKEQQALNTNHTTAKANKSVITSLRPSAKNKGINSINGMSKGNNQSLKQSTKTNTVNEPAAMSLNQKNAMLNKGDYSSHPSTSSVKEHALDYRNTISANNTVIPENSKIKKNELTNNSTTNDTSLKINTQTVPTNKTKHTMQNNQHTGLYAGITAGFDVSTIKLQSIKKTGYSLGILVGYRLSNHWSVESGIMWDKKQYYSTGKYFDAKKAGFPYNDKILHLDGFCNMFEVPVAVKYDFSAKAKGNFFAMAGLSSYVMHKEDYSYLANMRENGMDNIYPGRKTYNNSGSNLLSVMNLSAGYQFNIHNKSSLRIEPYVKIPLHGVGIGSLPITSTGVTVGFTRSLH